MQLLVQTQQADFAVLLLVCHFSLTRSCFSLFSVFARQNFCSTTHGFLLDSREFPKERLMAARQFEWDGTETAEAVWAYACQLGPRETARLRGDERFNRELELTRTEVLALVVAHQIRHPSIVINAREPTDVERALCDGVLESLGLRIDELLKAYQTPAGWFVKTNRHSPKDAPLDEPDERDIQFFREELSRLG